jgi:hypothetical protein
LNLKSIVIVLSMCLNLVLGIIIYNEVTKKEAVDVGLAFKQAVSVKNYDHVRTLLTEGREKQIKDEDLKKVNDLMSAGTTYKTYQLLEFDNGEMVLLNLTPNDKYEIQEVVIVPKGLNLYLSNCILSGLFFRKEKHPFYWTYSTNVQDCGIREDIT